MANVLSIKTARKRRCITINETEYEIRDVKEVGYAQRITLKATAIRMGVIAKADKADKEYTQEEADDFVHSLRDSMFIVFVDLPKEVEHQLYDDQRIHILNAFLLTPDKPAPEGQAKKAGKESVS